MTQRKMDTEIWFGDDHVAAQKLADAFEKAGLTDITVFIGRVRGSWCVGIAYTTNQAIKVTSIIKKHLQ